MASSRTPDPGAERRSVGIAVLVVSTYLVMTANGGMFLLVVSLKQMAGDFDWPRTVPSLAYALFFAGTGIGGIAMGYWFDRSGAGPVTLLGLAMIGAGVTCASDARIRSAPTIPIWPTFAKAVAIERESQAPTFATAVCSRM